MNECMGTTGRRSRILALLAVIALHWILSAGCSRFYVKTLCISVEGSPELKNVISERPNPDRINIAAGYFTEDHKNKVKSRSLRLESMIRMFFYRKKLFSDVTFLETVKDGDNLEIRMRMTRDTSGSQVGKAFLFGVTLGLTGMKVLQEYEFHASFHPLTGEKFEKTYRLAVHNIIAPQQPPEDCEIVATADVKVGQKINRDFEDWKLIEKFLTLLTADLQREGYLQ